jgi:hypothetical protein
MMNANNDSPMASRILGEIAQEYKWRDYPIPPVYKPIPDKEPKVTERLKAFYQQAADGKFDKDLFTPQFAETIENWLKNGEKDFLHNLGEIQSFILVERTDKDGKRLYRYRISFKDSVLLTQFLFDKDDKITDLQSSID